MTIPADVLRRADQFARRWDRSRSWVISEAIRHLPASYPTSSQTPALDRYRRRQLTDDLALSPLARVLAAERTAREVPPRRYATLIVSFDRREDYLEWKALETAGLR